MRGVEKTIDSQKIKEAFLNMDYGQNLDGTAKADEWLKTVNVSDQSGDVNNIIENIKSKFWDCKPKQRKLVLQKFAQEIEKNVDMICQIEIQSRGLLSRDTEKYVLLLSNYMQYYANFCVMDHEDSDSSKLKHGFVAAIFKDDSPLWMLALVLGPALAAGYNIVLQAGTKLTFATKFLVELAKNVGVPEPSLTIISSNEGNLQTYLDNTNIHILALFADLLDPKYQGINKRLIKLLHFSPCNAPMIVFDSSDIDSAIENLVFGAWGYQSMQPWTINKVLIQETIFERFTAKLKKRLQTVKMGNGNNKLADISFPSNPLVATKLRNTVEKAKSLGVEIFQNEKDSVNFTPTLLIGINIETNNLIQVTENNGAVTLLSFRSIEEAVNLANNSRQGFGASVWTENIGLANEVVRKLDVNNVWINCHGLVTAEVSLMPLKANGNACFGGIYGFYEYLCGAANKENVAVEALSVNPDQAITNAINSAKNASISWGKMCYLNRLKILSSIFDEIENTTQNSKDDLLHEYIDNYTKVLNNVLLKRTTLSYLSPFTGYNITVANQPRGVLLIKCGGNLAGESKLLLNAILEGNSVVLLTGCVGPLIKEKVYLELSKMLPSGLLSVSSYSNEAAISVVSHKAVTAYYNISSSSDDLFRFLPLSQSKVYCKFNNWQDSFSKLTVSKNMWTNIGQSITCSL